MTSKILNSFINNDGIWMASGFAIDNYLDNGFVEVTINNNSSDLFIAETKEWKGMLEDAVQNKGMGESNDWTMVNTPISVLILIVVMTIGVLFDPRNAERRAAILRRPFVLFQMFGMVVNFFLFFNSLMVMNSKRQIIQWFLAKGSVSKEKVTTVTWLIAILKCFQALLKGLQDGLEEDADNNLLLIQVMRPINAWLVHKLYSRDPMNFVVILNTITELMTFGFEHGSIASTDLTDSRLDALLDLGLILIALLEMFQLNVIAAHSVAMLTSVETYSHFFIGWLLLYSFGSLGLNAFDLEDNIIYGMSAASPIFIPVLYRYISRAI